VDVSQCFVYKFRREMKGEILEKHETNGKDSRFWEEKLLVNSRDNRSGLIVRSSVLKTWWE
jgi:hypothetical protein